MKLIFCPKCQDVVKLRKTRRSCTCRQSYGMYEADELHATIGGKAIPLGFLNASLMAALLAQPEEGMGSRFEAFVIPKQCPTVRVTHRKKSKA